MKVCLDDQFIFELVVDVWKVDIKMVQVLVWFVGIVFDDFCGYMVLGDDDGDYNYGGCNCEGECMEEIDWFY